MTMTRISLRLVASLIVDLLHSTELYEEKRNCGCSNPPRCDRGEKPGGSSTTLCPQCLCGR